MARRLLRAGHRLIVFDIRAEAVRPLADLGAVAAPRVAAVAPQADVVFTSLPLPEDVLEAYMGQDGVCTAMAKGTICVDVSTIDPFTARRLADGITAAGGSFIACPVGKGPAQAAEGSVPLFVGGPVEAVGTVGPVLDVIGRPLYMLGDVEQATAFKLISNLIGMSNAVLLAEGTALGRKAGIDPTVFAAALRDTGAHSYQLELRLPWMLDRDFAPRFSVALALKDLRLAVDMAARWKVPTPLGAGGLQTLSAAAARGLEDKDVAAVFELFEDTEGTASR